MFFLFFLLLCIMNVSSYLCLDQIRSDFLHSTCGAPPDSFLIQLGWLEGKGGEEEEEERRMLRSVFRRCSEQGGSQRRQSSLSQSSLSSLSAHSSGWGSAPILTGRVSQRKKKRRRKEKQREREGELVWEEMSFKA